MKCVCYLVQYVRTLGISEQWQFVDVWGFESDLLQLLPRPICAVLLLYPLSDKVFSVLLFGVYYLNFVYATINLYVHDCMIPMLSVTVLYILKLNVPVTIYFLGCMVVCGYCDIYFFLSQN